MSTHARDARSIPEETARLAVVLVLQYIEKLTDQQAADAVRTRVDWKYALGLTLDDPGFDASVLSQFRVRLLETNASILLLQVLSEYCKPRGFNSVLAQHELLYLAAGRHGVGLHELEVARDLLAADLPFTVLAHLLLAELLAHPGQDHRQQLFAKESIRHAEHLHVGYLGVANEELLDLAREEVLTTANHHFFEAPHDIDVALRVHRHQVA